jgi:putative FmdB family regulatory protein
MPIYEYKCRSCEHCFELLVLPRAVTAPECPECHGADLEQLISSFSAKSEATSRAAFSKAKQSAEKSIREEKIGKEQEFRDHH